MFFLKVGFFDFALLFLRKKEKHVYCFFMFPARVCSKKGGDHLLEIYFGGCAT